VARPWLAAAALLALASASLGPPSAGACSVGGASVAAGVPCGYIYPRLLFQLGERGQSYEVRTGQPLDLQGTLTFTWDVTAEGMAVANPTQPIEVTFQFPQLPPWLNASVEPARVEVPITPDHLEANQTGAGLQVVYRYEAPIQLHARLTAQPEVQPEQPPSLLLLASSSESGLYKPGFGVRDLTLRLPEAVVKDPPLRQAQLRVADAQPLELPELNRTFEGAELRLRASGPVRLWEPAALTASVLHAGQAVSDLDMAASVVDERNEVLYTTGLRHRPDGALAFTTTFPAPGQYRLLVAARPLAGVSGYLFEPVIGVFPVTLPGLDAEALRYPATYRAVQDEPAAEFHANTQDPPRQFEKLLRFPVLGDAEALSAQVQLGSTAGPGIAAGSLYAELLGAGDEQLAYQKLDAVNPSMDVRLRGPLAPGAYKLHVYGTGLNPLGLAGTMVHEAVGVFYEQGPVARVLARGQPQTVAGGPIALGTGGAEAELVLEQAPAVWQAGEAMLVVKDAQGRVALHPDFILTVTRPDGDILYTTGHRHPHDGLLHWGFPFDRPGVFLVNAYSGPTPEASGAFWQPAIASWPLRVPGPEHGWLTYPAQYHAHYHESTSSVRLDPAGGYAYWKDFPVPVKQGAQRLAARLDLVTSAMVQHVEGAGPARLTLQLLRPAAGPGQYGTPAAGETATLAGQAKVAAEAPEPGTWTLRVVGVGYAPLDYAGSLYDLDATVSYAGTPGEDLGPASAPPAPSARPLPGPGLVLLAALALGAARAVRRWP
jgi:hypothetical protein